MLFTNRSKCQRSSAILSLLIIITSLVSENVVAIRERGARCEKPDYIPNGSYRLRRERVMRIHCNIGFILQGSKTIDCVRGKWEGEKPVCAKKGCSNDLEQPENGRIQIENNLKAILYCLDNYNLAGNRHSYCNGTHWDRPIGNCRERKNIVQHDCDFETDDICGWTYEPQEGLEWKRVMAANVFTTFKTGPRHDHTTLTANGGHYMLMESLTKNDDFITLTSPIYERNLSLKTACCFQFYYFMYGAGVGDLFVVVKPITLSLNDLFEKRKELIKFQKYGNQNNIWNEAHFNIEELNEDFQIIFVAKSGRGQLSDIAVDDVRLLTGDACRALDNKEDEDMSNEDSDSTTYESIYEMESCVGRCFDSHGIGVVRYEGHLKGLCNCDADCEDNDTCCPDFKEVCLNEIFFQSTIVPLSEETTKENVEQIISSSTKEGTTTSTTAKAMTTSITTSTTPTTVKTTPTTTTASTTTTTTTTTTTSTTPKPIIVTTKTTPRTTTTRKTTIRTTPTTTTKRNTTPTTTTTRKTTPSTTTTRKTTPKTTPRITTRKTTTTLRTTPSTRRTTTTTSFPRTTTTTAATKNSEVVTFIPDQIPDTKPIEYIINDASKTKTSHKGSHLFLYLFILIVAIIVMGAIYRRFGDRAVAWYLIHYKKNRSGVDDSSSITTTSFKQTTSNGSTNDDKSKSKWRNKTKKTSGNKSNMNSPLIDEDDDEDNYNCSNGNIVLKSKMFTDL